MSLLEELEAYSKACIADAACCCVKHRWACMRFLRDVERAGTDDFPYVFDEPRAERFYAWARLHKHTKGILAGEPIELAPAGYIGRQGFAVSVAPIGRWGARTRSRRASRLSVTICLWRTGNQ